MIDLEARVRQARELDLLAPLEGRLAHLVAADDPDLNRIVDDLSRDGSLVSLLRAVAEAESRGEGGSVSTARDAVTRIGIGRTLALAFARRLRGWLCEPLQAYGQRREQLWSHSLAAAFAVECMQGRTDAFLPPEATAAALMHDVGKPLLGADLEQPVLDGLARAVNEGGCSGTEAEQEVLGAHHGEIGALIAQTWRLPDDLVQAIAGHHDPDAELSTLCDVIAVADEVAHGFAGRACNLRATSAAMRLGVDEARFAEILEATGKRMQREASIWGG